MKFMAAHRFGRKTGFYFIAGATMTLDSNGSEDAPRNVAQGSPITGQGKEFEKMRMLGSRKERPISRIASGVLLAEGARFNDEIHRLPTGNRTFIPKGLYCFMTHAEANQHQLDCLTRGMAKIAQERADGGS
jgi:hypothetical protein